MHSCCFFPCMVASVTQVGRPDDSPLVFFPKVLVLPLPLLLPFGVELTDDDGADDMGFDETFGRGCKREAISVRNWVIS